MNKAKRKRLEKAGWKIGTVQEFFGLTNKQARRVEMISRLTILLEKLTKK